MELSERRNKRLLRLCCPLMPQRPEVREEFGVLTGVLLDVPPDVDGAVQNGGVCSKRALQCKALCVAPIAHERLRGKEPSHEPEEPLECIDRPVTQVPHAIEGVLFDASLASMTTTGSMKAFKHAVSST